MNWKDLFPKENRYFETDNGILYCGDCLEIMPKFSKKVFDAIITDPPYGITACKWDVVIPFEDMWKCLKKIRKNRTPIVLFGSEPFSSYLRISNIKEYKYDWVWIKSRILGHLVAKYRPLEQKEVISVFGKGRINYYPIKVKRNKTRIDKRKGENGSCQHLNFKNKVDRIAVYVDKFPTTVLFFKSEHNVGFYTHPTKKPLLLLEYLVKTYTNKGDLVLDFTCGSGTTLVACEKLNRRWIGIEIKEKYCEISKNRILKESKQKRLFL